MAQPKKKGKHKCSIPSCPDAAEILDKCRKCYSAEYYWTKKRTPKERRKRQQRLQVFQERLDDIEAGVQGRPNLRVI